MQPKSWPQRLLTSAVLIAAAVGILFCGYALIPWDKLDLFTFFPALLVLGGASGAMIGAAIFGLFHRAKLGAILGLASPVCLILWLLIDYLLHPAIG